MKKAALLILVCIHLLATTGVSAAAHYCALKTEAVPQKCNACVRPQNKPLGNCCHTSVKLVKLEQTALPAMAALLQLQAAVVVRFSAHLFEIFAPGFSKKLFVPLIISSSGPPLWVQHRVLRI